jgi:hypothetical protein
VKTKGKRSEGETGRRVIVKRIPYTFCKLSSSRFLCVFCLDVYDGCGILLSLLLFDKKSRFEDKMRNRNSSTKKEFKIEAERLLGSNDALSSSEQEMVLQYLAEANDGTNKVFLVISALLHGVLGGLYLFLFASKDRTLPFLLEPKMPQPMVRVSLFVSAATMLSAGIALATFVSKIRFQFDVSSWLSLDSATKLTFVESEKLRLADKFKFQRRFHSLAAAVATIPAILFAAETLRSLEPELLDFLAAVWQPFVHLGMCMILSWMQESQIGVVQLLAATYTHEKA